MTVIYQILETVLPFSWLDYNFMKNAFVAILLITPLLGVLGTMAVNNKMAFFRCAGPFRADRRSAWRAAGHSKRSH